MSAPHSVPGPPVSSLCCTGAPTEESLALIDNLGSGLTEDTEKALAGLHSQRRPSTENGGKRKT